MAAARSGRRPIRDGALRWPIAALLLPLSFRHPSPSRPAARLFGLYIKYFGKVKNDVEFDFFFYHEVTSETESLRFKIAEEGVHSPRGVAVHPGLGRVYWTDWDRYRPAIQMANMDGTGRQVSLCMKFLKVQFEKI